MNLKKAVPLVAALVLGLIAYLIVLRTSQSNKGSASQIKQSQVVVVKQDVPAGEALTPDDVTVGELATGTTLSTNAFTDPAELVGRVPTIPLIAGQAITESVLAPKGSGTGLQAIVPAGMRAITVEIDDISGVANYLVPGCHVDILHCGRDEKTGDSYTKTIIQNIQVIAVGDRSAAGANNTDPARSVTLLATPRQAEVITLASAIGRPRFILRNSEDHSAAAAAGVTVADLMVTPKQQPTVTAMVPATQPSIGDIFAAGFSSHHKNAPDFWSMRVITGGISSTIDVKMPQSNGIDSASINTAPTTATPQ